MEPERADKRYAARHGWSRQERIRHQLFEWGKALAILVIIGTMLAGGFVTHGPAVQLARDVTGTTASGMAAAGWLLVVAPFALTFLAWQLGEPERLSRDERRALHATRSARIRRLARIALAILGAPLGIVAVTFLPARGARLTDIITGPGAPAFRIGLVAGWVTAFLGVLAVLLLGPRETLDSRSRAAAGRPDRRRLTRVALPLWALATLTAAVILAALS